MLRTEVEEFVRKIYAEILQRDETDLTNEKSFLSLGGDSLLAVFVVARCRDAGYAIDPADIFQAGSISELSKRICALESPSTESITQKKPAIQTTHGLPLTDLQRSYVGARWTQTWHLELAAPVSQETLQSVLVQLSRRHAMLCARFFKTPSGSMAQKLFKNPDRSFAWELRPEKSQIERESTAQRLAKGLGQPGSPVFGAVLFGTKESVSRVALMAHRAAVDMSSWTIILREFEQLLSHGSLPFAEEPTYFDWVHAIVPARHDERQPQYGERFTAISTLDSSSASILFGESCHRALRTTAGDVICAAVQLSMEHCEHQFPGNFTFSVMDDGRLHDMTSQWRGIVGCFDEMTHLDAQQKESGDARLVRRVKDARRGPRKSNSPSSNQISTRETKPILVDLARLPCAQARNERKERQYRTDQYDDRILSFGDFEISVSAQSIDGNLTTSFSCSSSSFTQETVSRIARTYEHSLKRIVETLSESNAVATLSDFPDMRWTYSELDSFFRTQLSRVSKQWVSDVEAVHPCSTIQEKCLLGQAIDPEAYQCSFSVKLSLHKEVNIDDLAAAWTKTVSKTSILRTLFVETPHSQGQYVQVVLKQVRPDIISIDARGNQSFGLTTNHKIRPFSGFQVPHRLTIVRTSATEALLTLEISHALIDGHSAELLLQNITVAYLGLEPTPEKLPYSRYVEYQNSQDTSDSPPYWSEYLAKADSSQVPVTIDQPLLKDLRTLKFQLGISEASVKAFQEKYNFTMANACQVAWGLVLKCLVGRENVCFSFISAARHLPLKGIMEAVGPYMTTLICTLELPEQARITDLLRRAGDDYKSFVRHQRELPSDMSARQFGNSVISFRRKLGQDKSTKHGLDVEVIDAYSPTDYDLSFVIQADDNTLDVSMDFWLSRISEKYGKAILDTFREALRSVLRSPDGLVGDMNLIPQDHLLQTLEWNQEVPPTTEACVADLVHATARQQPRATAVDAWDGLLTYEELASYASQLASRLMEMGIGPETMVGLCMSKSKWGTVAMLAILQAGAAVVPLGIEHPMARIKAILEDSAPALVLVDEAQEKRLAGVAKDMIILDDALLDGIERPNSPWRTCPTVQPHNAAWIVYTSGSTGTPKGVVLENSSLSSSMKAHGKTFGIGTHSRVLQFAAYTFDAAIQENITTLIFGGCVCVPSESDRLSNLSSAISALRVNFLGLTSSTASVLDPRNLPHIDTLVLFGEPLKAKVVEMWLPHTPVLNGYGPTECSIFSSCSAPLQNLSEISTIGYPLGCNFWIVDPSSNYNRLAPIGVPGELLIEGPILGRGYLNDATKTNAAFVVDPGFVRVLPKGLDKGRRMYRTGDIVQQNSDGALVYIGRRDTMVKLRGQRLDVSEPEYWISKLREDVASVVVDIPSTKQQLVAAIEFSPEGVVCDQAPGSDGLFPPSATLQNAFDELQKQLSQKLPAYMVPTIYVPVVKMPLTISGKTDRRAVLALLDKISSSTTRQYLKAEKGSMSKPVTDTERLLQALWAKTLGVDEGEIGTRDHFLHIGGDSISAIRLVQEAQAANLALKVSDIFKTPCLGDLAALVDEHSAVTDEAVSDDPAPFELWKDSQDHEAGHDKIEDQIQTVASRIGLSAEDVVDIHPCTPIQEALMAVTMQNPTAYISRQVFELDETVDMNRLRASWDVLAESAPILRSRILLGRETVQVVTKGPLDWYESENLDEYLTQDRNKGISPGEPLTRLGLVHDAATSKRFFVWTAHHSSYDGWSANLMYRSVVDIYQGTELPRPVPYGRFLKHVQSLDREAAQGYWREQLEGANVASFPALPHQHYRPKPTNRLQQKLPAMPTMQLGFSTAAVLQGAWAMAVAQYTGMEESMFSMTVTGRSAPVNGVARIVAPTIATVPVRVCIDRSLGVQDYLSAIHDQAVGMIPFEHTGMQTIKDLLPEMGSTLEINNHLVVQPVVEKDHMRGFLGMSLVEDNEPKDAFHYSALTVECQLEAGDVDSGATAHAMFDSFVISETRVGAILRQFAHLVGELSLAATAGNMPLSQIDQLNPYDRASIRATNETPPEPIRSCIHHLIDAMVEKQPSAVAVQAWDGSMTYAELNEQAKSLARHLVLTAGIGPDKMVGLCMDKSKWAVVAMLAILHAGGAVVGLNVQNPLDRIRTMMEDCSAAAILVDAPQASRLAGVVPHIVPVEETLRASPERAPTGPVNLDVGPQHAAWVIYTSGSTGTPKGVVLEHSALCSSMLAHGALFKLGPSSRVLQFATHSFDVCIQEVCATLIYAGCVCVPSEDQRMSIRGLTSTIAEMKVDTLGLTSTTASLIRPSETPSVKRLILFGEAVKPSVVETWLGFAEILNAYGPSECSIHSSCSRPIKSIDDAPIIGYPIYACFWVADIHDYNKLSPIGAVGELLIEGPQLARGYLNDLIKTEQAFVTNPAFVSGLDSQNGLPRRMYRTGDLVRQDFDGQLTYLGRRDTQVKINGQRVDVGEIEYWIGKLLHGVRAAVVDLISWKEGAKPALVAALDFEGSSPYSKGLVKDGSNIFETSDVFQDILTRLRDSLREKLPAYMVPSFFLPMTNIPLTATGKTDRRSTKQLVSVVPPLQLRSYLAESIAKELPASRTGLKLRILWAKVLGTNIDDIGAQDDFLELGGDSIRAIRLVEDARTDGMHLTMAMVFQYPRLSDLANQVDEQISEDHANTLEDPASFSLWQAAGETRSRLDDIATACNISADQIEDVYPSTPLQEALLAITMHRPDAYVSRRTFKVAKEIDAVRLQDSWQTVAQAAPVLRTRILPQGKGGAIQAVVRTSLVWNEGTNLKAYMAEDFANGIQYGRPLVRCGLIQEPSGDRYFVWTAHHSVYDGWSLQLLYSQVASMYRDGSIPRSVPHTRFIRYLGQIDPKAARKYWQKSLQGDGTPACIPRLGHRHNSPKTVQHLQRRLKLDATPLMRLKASLSNILRAAWALVLAQYTGADDVLFAVTVSGRTAPVMDITDMVAPTIATVPVRLRVNRAAGVRDYVNGVQQHGITMMAYEHIGLQGIKKLAPELSPLLDINHLFVVQPAAESEGSLNFPGLEPIEDETATPFHDLAFVLQCDLPAKDVEEIIVSAMFDHDAVPSYDVDNMLRQLEHVVGEFARAAAEEPNRVLGNLKALSAHDVALLQAANATAPVPAHICVHELVSATAERMPAALAVDAHDGQFTYEQFHTQTLLLASHLIYQGVRLGDRIGVCMDKSKWAPVAILAVLHIGATVVPMGVQDPLPRIKHVVGEAAISLVLTDDRQAKRLGDIGPRISVVGTGILETPNAEQIVFPVVDPLQAAWILYTSDNTGTPKGVVLDHQALSTSIQAQGPALGYKPGMRVFQYAAHTLDVAIQEICTTLVHGACVCIPSEKERIASLVETITKFRAQMLRLTASTALSIRRSDVPTVERLILGGEPAKHSLLDGWRGVEVVSAYGVSEASIHSACGHPLLETETAASIGAPLACNFWITDPLDQNRLCPVGAIGELLTEGPTIAQGYLNDAAKTEADFIIDPEFLKHLSLPTGRRMYRTGSLVRQSSDSSFTYVGRRDMHATVRGQLLDVGETEHWIHQLMSHAVTVVVELIPKGLDRHHDTLVAVMDFDSETAYEQTSAMDPVNPLLPSDALRDEFLRLQTSLKRSLPSTLVPTAYVPLAKVPLDAANKTDRRAVREALASYTLEQLMAYVSKPIGPKSVKTEAEQSLRALWAETMELEESSIGRDDNFFDVGGDSIAAMRLVENASSRGIRLSIKSILEAPQLSAMAAGMELGMVVAPAHLPEYQRFSLLGASDLDAALAEIGSRVLPPAGVPKSSIVDVLPATDPQALNAVAAITKSQVEVYHWQIDGQGSMEPSELKKACQDLADQIEIFRTVYAFYDNQLMQVVLSTYEVDIPVIEAQSNLDAATTTLIREHESQPFLMGRPLMDMAILIRPETKEHRILFRMSHAAYDGYSFPIIWSTLQSLFDVGPPKSPSGFSSYVYDLQSRITDEARGYWQRHLQGSSMPQLSASRSPTDQTPFAMLWCRPRKLSKARTISSGITSAIAIKAAWGLLLGECLASNNVVFGDTISGRSGSHTTLLDTVGCCATHVPIRIGLQRDWTVMHLLRHVRDLQSERLPHEAVGFRDIFAKSTDWPTSTRFTSIVNHRRALPAALHLGAQQHTVKTLVPAAVMNLYDLALVSEEHDDRVDVSLGYSDSALSRALAEVLLKAVCDLVETFDTTPDMPLSAAFDGMQDSIAVLRARLGQPSSAVLTTSRAPAQNAVDPALEAIWHAVLDRKRAVPGAAFAAAPFSDLGGDLQDAALLAHLMQREDMDVGLDDVLECPSLLAMTGLVESRRR